MITQSSIFYAEEVSVGFYTPPSHNFNYAPPVPVPVPQVAGIAIGEAIKQLKVAKKASNRRPCYIKELNRVLVQFSRGIEHQPLESVTAEQIEAFLATKSFCPAARKGTIGRISALMEFGLRKRWVKFNVTRQIEKSILEWKIPKILTVEQVEKLMRACQKDQPTKIAYMALCLFVGLRPTEARQVTWDKITGDRMTIEAHQTKVRRRRIIHLEPAAVAWLDWAKANGAKLPLCEATRQLWNKWFRSVIGLEKWPQDIFRHSCLSYWLASRQSAEYVALQAGNSASILHRFYKEIVTKEEAEKFWSILP